MENSTTVRKIDSFDRESFTSASDCASSILDVLEMAGMCSVKDITWSKMFCSYLEAVPIASAPSFTAQIAAGCVEKS